MHATLAGVVEVRPIGVVERYRGYCEIHDVELWGKPVKLIVLEGDAPPHLRTFTDKNYTITLPLMTSPKFRRVYAGIIGITQRDLQYLRKQAVQKC